jgi:hypothetical protein
MVPSVSSCTEVKWPSSCANTRSVRPSAFTTKRRPLPVAGRRGDALHGGAHARRRGELVGRHGQHAVARGDGRDLVAREVVDHFGAPRAEQLQQERVVAGARVDAAVRVAREAHDVARAALVVDLGVAAAVDAVDATVGTGGRQERRAVHHERPHVLGLRELHQLADGAAGRHDEHAPFRERARVERAVRVEGQRGHQELPRDRHLFDAIAAQAQDAALVARAEEHAAVGRAHHAVDQGRVLDRDAAHLAAHGQAAVGEHGGAGQLTGRERGGGVHLEAARPHRGGA